MAIYFSRITWTFAPVERSVTIQICAAPLLASKTRSTVSEILISTLVVVNVVVFERLLVELKPKKNIRFSSEYEK